MLPLLWYPDLMHVGIQGSTITQVVPQAGAQRSPNRLIQYLSIERSFGNLIAETYMLFYCIKSKTNLATESRYLSKKITPDETGEIIMKNGCF